MSLVPGPLLMPRLTWRRPHLQFTPAGARPSVPQVRSAPAPGTPPCTPHAHHRPPGASSQVPRRGRTVCEERGGEWKPLLQSARPASRHRNEDRDRRSSQGAYHCVPSRTVQTEITSFLECCHECLLSGGLNRPGTAIPGHAQGLANSWPTRVTLDYFTKPTRSNEHPTLPHPTAPPSGSRDAEPGWS